MERQGRIQLARDELEAAFAVVTDLELSVHGLQGLGLAFRPLRFRIKLVLGVDTKSVGGLGEARNSARRGTRPVHGLRLIPVGSGLRDLA